MAFFTSLVVTLLINIAIAELLAKSPKSNIKAKGLDDFTFPTVSADRSIPCAIGDVFISSSNVTWYGDYQKKAITDKVKKSFFSSSNVVVGYQYFVGMEFALCWGQVDELTEVWFGEYQAWTGSVTSQGEIFTVDSEDLFGGRKNGGGVYAKCALYKGTQVQDADTYMTTQVGEAYAHRGLAKVVWYGPSYAVDSGMMGEASSVSAVGFRVKILPQYLASGFHDINGEANPAEAIYSLLTGKFMNLVGDPVTPAVTTDQIDTAQFITVAEALYDEGMGISFQWQQPTASGDIIADILRHIDATLVEDPTTGKVQLKLARDDYDAGTLPTLGPSNCTVTQLTRRAISSTVNEVVATYTNKEANFRSEPLTVQDIGNMFAQRAASPTQLDLTMFTDASIVNQRATSELNELSSPLARGSITCDRNAYSLSAGSVFKLDWPALGISGLVCRVLKINYGDLRTRKIKVEFVEDVYSLGTAIYSDPTPTNWVEVRSNPIAATDYKLSNIPYRLLDSNGAEQVSVMVSAPTGDSVDFNLQSRTGTEPYSYDIYGAPFTETALLSENLSGQTNAIHAAGVKVNKLVPFGTATDSDIKTGFVNWALINDELVAFTGVTDHGNGTSTLTGLYRGLLDTVPTAHTTGDRIWFLDSAVSTGDVYSATDSLDVKVMPKTTNGTLDEGSAPVWNYTVTDRALAPYPPGNIRINSNYVPISYSGDSTIEWDQRDRTDTTIRSQDDTDDTAEATATVSLKVYGDSDVLLHTESPATSPFVYTLAQEAADAGALQSQLRFELYSTRDAIDSIWSQSRTVIRPVIDSTEFTADLDESVSEVSTWTVDLDAVGG